MFPGNYNIRVSIIILLLSVQPMASYAQVGIRVGIGVSDIGLLDEGQIPFFGYEINSLMHNWPLPSYQAGLVYKHELSKRFDVTPGLLISQQGFNCNNNFLYDKVTYRMHVTYLKMPLSFKLRTNVAKGRRSGIIVAPYVAARARAVMRIRVEDILSKRNMENVNAIDLGSELAYAWDIGRDPGKLLLDFRLSYSLINSMSPTSSYIPKYYGPEKIYARNINIALALEYNIS